MTSHQAFVGIENGIQVKDNKYPSDMRINKTPTSKKNTVNMIYSYKFYINSIYQSTSCFSKTVTMKGINPHPFLLTEAKTVVYPLC